MELHPIFKLRSKPTGEIIQLLESVTLGTDGAKYKHLDTRSRILESDDPLFISLERHDKPLGNITFLRRGSNWYLRYFAFDKWLQAGGNKRTKGEGMLKKNVEQLFLNAMHGEYGEKVNYFYAYIDPKNTKSLWFAENFGFEPISRFATQTFSRSRPKKRVDVIKSNDWNEVKQVVVDNYGGHEFFNDHHTSKPPFYLVKDDKFETIAFCKMTEVTWEIERLPGRFGGLLTKIIPFIPVLRKIIHPKEHRFLVPDAVYVKDNDPQLLEDFFETILNIEKRNLIIWWVDKKEPLFKKVSTSLKWGILHKMIGVSEVYLMVRKNPQSDRQLSGGPAYAVGFDFV